MAADQRAPDPFSALDWLRDLAARARRGLAVATQDRFYGIAFLLGIAVVTAHYLAVGASWLAGLGVGVGVGFGLLFVWAFVSGVLGSIERLSGRSDLPSWLLVVAGTAVYSGARVGPWWLAVVAVVVGLAGLWPVLCWARREAAAARAQIGVSEQTLEALLTIPDDQIEAVRVPLGRALATFLRLRDFLAAQTRLGQLVDRDGLLIDAEAALAALAARAPGVAGLFELGDAAAVRALAGFEADVAELEAVYRAVLELAAQDDRSTRERLGEQRWRLRELAEGRDEVEQELHGEA